MPNTYVDPDNWCCEVLEDVFGKEPAMVPESFKPRLDSYCQKCRHRLFIELQSCFYRFGPLSFMVGVSCRKNGFNYRGHINVQHT